VFKDMLDGDVFKYYVDGAWTPTTSGKSVGIINPSTLKPLFKIAGDVAPASACFLSFFGCSSHVSDLHGNSARLNHVKSCTQFSGSKSCIANQRILSVQWFESTSICNKGLEDRSNQTLE